MLRHGLSCAPRARPASKSIQWGFLRAISEFDETFTEPGLDPGRWVAHYLPHWTTPADATLEEILADVLFEAPEKRGQRVVVDAAYARARLDRLDSAALREV